jgi:hypothetical protein
MTLTPLVMLWAAHAIAAPAIAHAECVTPASTPAGWLRHRSVIFVGDVVAIRDERVDNDQHQLVTFTVVEAFKGIKPGQRTLRFVGAWTVDGFTFLEESLRMLVVAQPAGRNRHFAGCTPTRALSKVIRLWTNCADSRDASRPSTDSRLGNHIVMTLDALNQIKSDMSLQERESRYQDCIYSGGCEEFMGSIDGAAENVEYCGNCLTLFIDEVPPDGPELPKR